MKTDSEWLNEATVFAMDATRQGDAPIASILVADGTELSRGFTGVVRNGSVETHGETEALRLAGFEVWKARRPLILYTNLEPCLMCVGAGLNAGVDEIVYAMSAKSDGAHEMTDHLRSQGFGVPIVRQAGSDIDTRAQFERFVAQAPGGVASDYVRSILV